MREGNPQRIKESVDERAAGESYEHRRTVVKAELRTESLIGGQGDLAPIEAQSAAQNLEASALAYLEEAEKARQQASDEYPLRRVADEARYLLHREQMLVAAELVRKGRYSAVPLGDPYPPKPAGTELVASGPYNHKTMGIVEVVVFVPNDLPRVFGRLKQHAELSAAAEEEYVGVFNNWAYEERKKRWEAHLAARTEIRQVRGDGSLRDAERARRVETLEQMLVDTSRFRLEMPGYFLRRRL